MNIRSRTMRSGLVAGATLAAVLLALPANAITPASKSNRSGGAATAAPSAMAAAAAMTREGFIQAIDPSAQSIVINSANFTIGAPLLALLDKRPKADGLLTLATLKVGMFVRYRVDGQRVVEMWVIRDPQIPGGTRP